MNRRAAKFLIVGGILVFGVLGGLFIGHSPTKGPGINNASDSFTLVAPAFAQGIPSDQFPMNEAGISAYVKVDQTIDLTKAKPLFKVLEDEKPGYIIGTVELSGYAEDWWPHVWIDKSGWILVYYPKAEPTSKLMHWSSYLAKGEITTTTLRETLFSVARKLGVDMAKVSSNMSYYHWQYPEATKMLIVIDSAGGSNSFRYTVPNAMTVFQGSGSHYGRSVDARYNEGWSETTIDGARLLRGGEGTYTLCAELKEAQLAPGVPHTVVVHNNGGSAAISLFFLYR
jgi:hypothetical protein